MKEAWRRSADSRIETDIMDDARSEAILSGKRVTALERLADRYRKFYRMAFVFAPLSVFWCMNIVGEEPYRYGFMVFMVVYFLIVGFMDKNLYDRVMEIDVQEMPTSEVIFRALDCRRLHLKYIMVLIPMCIIFVGMTVWMFIDTTEIIMAIAIGLIIGLAIGIYNFREFMRDYKTIRDDMKRF